MEHATLQNVPVALDYARPIEKDRPRSRVKFGAEMIKASVAACIITSVASSSRGADLLLLYGVALWVGVAIAWAYRHFTHDGTQPSGPKTRSDVLWRPVVVLLAITTGLMTFRYGACPHQKYWAVGPFISETVTDPRGPCNNERKLRPALLRWLFD